MVIENQTSTFSLNFRHQRIIGNNFSVDHRIRNQSIHDPEKSSNSVSQTIIKMWRIIKRSGHLIHFAMQFIADEVRGTIPIPKMIQQPGPIRAIDDACRLDPGFNSYVLQYFFQHSHDNSFFLKFSQKNPPVPTFYVPPIYFTPLPFNGSLRYFLYTHVDAN